MVVSEINILEFLTGTLRLPHEEAKSHVRNLVAAEEKLHRDITETIDRKFEERKDVLVTKEEIHSLELKMEQRFGQVDQRFGALEVLIERNTNKLLIWLISAVVAVAGLVLTIAKLIWT